MITIPAKDFTQKDKQLFEFEELSNDAKVNAMNLMKTTQREVLHLKYYTRSGQPYIAKSKFL